MRMPIRTEIDIDDLAEEIVNHLSYGDIVDLIAQIDAVTGDWELTNLIYGWADAQHDEFVRDHMDFDHNH